MGNFKIERNVKVIQMCNRTIASAHSH